MFFDPHIHMISRTTDDYQAMRAAGIVGVIEPSFWLGQPRTSAASYRDYLSTLVGWERFRAQQFGIRHYCTIGLNPKEANDERLADEVMELLPLYASKDGVVAIGEVGFDDATPAEERYFRAQLELALELDMVVMVHTPHRDKRAGTLRSMDLCDEHGLPPHRVVIDHNNETTARDVLDRGFWAAFTIYPHTKMGNARMVEVVKEYGCERVIVDSSADWGVSDPLAVPKTARLMELRGLSPAAVRAVCCQNAIAAYGQTGRMDDFERARARADTAGELYAGNSVLRGQDSIPPAAAAPFSDEQLLVE